MSNGNCGVVEIVGGRLDNGDFVGSAVMGFVE